MTDVGAVTSFTYDHRNRLIAVENRNASNTLVQSVEYVYDVFDRRIAKTVDADGTGVAVAMTTHFVYDGEHVWADYDASENVIARYLTVRRPHRRSFGALLAERRHRLVCDRSPRHRARSGR